ncbi:hypothetical protein EII34_04475 [Arachnia propionica]|uniref:SWIM-type domain-containing protein n=1 Tax=Arachnia propionica TaxID=1750 RepID=A0A3P1T909_9ACTN|nr:hypothetical protein [Arachnia propionica]RRD05947.1 hypothetical protein EII34_04475 [Arachnia propionica]
MRDISPAVLAGIVEALAPRVRKRVDALLASPPELATVVDFGNATVRVAEVDRVTDQAQLTCDCLLAPACAHRAVVALLLPVADEEENPPPADAAPEPVRAESSRTPLRAAQRDAVTIALTHLRRVLLIGTTRLSAADRGDLAADLHRMRTFGLVTADRALTGYVSSLRGRGRPNLAGFASALLNLHRLEQLGPGDPSGDLLGRARETYRDVGGLRLTPLCAEPILTASGFAGSQVTFNDAGGRVWKLTRVRPGTARDVPTHYLAGETWAGISDSHAVLSRHRLLISDATARDDGRLGGGRQVRAARGEAVAGWEHLPDGYHVVAGPVTGGNRTSLEVAGTPLRLLPAARALGAGLATELFGAALGAEVTCLVHDGHLLGMRTSGELILIPEGLGDLWWPGLDVVDRSWAGTLPVAPHPESDLDPADWAVTSPEVQEITSRWCARVLEAGQAALGSPSLTQDIAWVSRAGAPFAAELLQRLADSTREGRRRFDGTWEPDPEALARAWLAVSQY